MSTATVNERTTRFLRYKALGAMCVPALLIELWSQELLALKHVDNMGECAQVSEFWAKRLVSFGLAEAGTVRAGAWKLTSWGKLVAQAAKEGAQ